MTAHVDVAQALKPLFTTHAGKKFRDQVGFGPGGLVVACEPDEHLVDVLDRVQKAEPPVIIAFLDAGRLRLVVVRPVRLKTDDAAHRGMEPQSVSRRVTVGMFYAAAAATGETLFRINEWAADQVAIVPPIPA